jgi:hypothetical protein
MQNPQYIHTNLLLYCSNKFYKFNQVSNNESEQRNFTHLIRCQKVKPYTILNTSRKHVNYEEDKNKVPMNKRSPRESFRPGSLRPIAFCPHLLIVQN